MKACSVLYTYFETERNRFHNAEKEKSVFSKDVIFFFLRAGCGSHGVAHENFISIQNSICNQPQYPHSSVL